MRARRMGPPCILAALALLAACELQETTVVDVADVVVVEAYALVGVPGRGASNRLWAFLSRTVGDREDLTVPGARIEVERPDGAVLELEEADAGNCVREEVGGRAGTCYDAGFDAVGLRPRDALTIRVELPDGRVIEGDTRVPGDFEIDGDPVECRIPADVPYEIRWSRSEGARTYVNETRIDGLDEALASEGIDAPPELYLLGLSISDADTTIVFPGEFGVFERFDLDQALAIRLQRGLPAGARALVGISAADHNYVSWARGGNFNPSGQVRVPSMRGDGTGVFASVVMRRFMVSGGPSGDGAPCSGVQR